MTLSRLRRDAIREVIVPAVHRGRAKRGLTLPGFDLGCPAFIGTGADAEQLTAATEAIWRQNGAATTIDDELPHAFAVLAEPERLPERLL